MLLKTALGVLLVVAVVESATSSSEWEKFKSTHSKVYASSAEETKRWTNDEYKKMLTYQMHNDTDGSSNIYTSEDVNALPDRIDWRAYGYVTGVKRQEACAASYAFAAVGALEGQMFRRYGSSRSLSVQNIIDCASKCQGCLGGCTIRAFQYVADNGGISTDEGYPYQATVRSRWG
ncbi:cathepsin l [Plakobranchus ocellatus]|uniref:Cathepsin l n=1 Tax=Plakobranchus ocellatus TaxID=259542 RepID=A0AAV4CYU4_9GAST|nr:cathepsin l [Plakobranchus ocellatus]